MGEVYRARDRKLGRDIALKVLPDQFAANPERLKRFEQEARLASSLNHPNIVTIHDIGAADGVCYIAMELIQGQTLKALFRAGRLSLSQAMDIAAQAADGLAKAHAAGIVHRDFKPENVMVTTDGFAKILDFGLGKQSALTDSDAETIEAASPGQTRPGAILGTVNYMSPEQAAGHSVDFRSDQFALGLVLYELVTGHKAFARPTSVQTLSAIVAEEAPGVGTLNPDVPARLREVIQRCLAKKPADRYGSTVDLARDLRSIARNESSINTLPPFPRPTKRRPSRRAVAALAALLLVVTIAALVTGYSATFMRWFGGVGEESIPSNKNVAVLPFRAVDGTPERQASADGLTLMLSSMLAKLTTAIDMQVAPANLVFGDQPSDAEGARKDVGATLVLRGTVEHTGDTVSVNTTLVDTASSRELRSRTVTALAADPVALQDRLLEAVLSMLDIPIGADERQSLVIRDTAVGPAGALYLQGRGYLQSFEKEENIDRAVDAFDAALKLDSKYARAFAARGEAYWRKSEFGAPQRWIEAAVGSCAQALVLDAALAAAHACLGKVNNATGQFKEAALNFERAIEGDPTDDDAYAGLALAKQRLGQIEDAEKTYLRAVALRPQYWVNHNRLGAFYYSLGRYSEAVQRFSQVVALAPDGFRGYSNLGGTLVLLGRYDEAITALSRSIEIHPDAVGYSNLGTAYFNRGRFEEAAATFGQAVKLEDTNYELWGNLADAQYFNPPMKAQAAASYRKAITLAGPELKVNPRNHLVLINLANYHAMVGERAEANTFLDRALAIEPKDGFVQFRAAIALQQLGDRRRALDALERAVSAGYSTPIIVATPNFTDLWQDPRFQKLVRGQ